MQYIAVEIYEKENFKISSYIVLIFSCIVTPAIHAMATPKRRHFGAKTDACDAPEGPASLH